MDAPQSTRSYSKLSSRSTPTISMRASSAHNAVARADIETSNNVPSSMRSRSLLQTKATTSYVRLTGGNSSFWPVLGYVEELGHRKLQRKLQKHLQQPRTCGGRTSPHCARWDQVDGRRGLRHAGALLQVGLATGSEGGGVGGMNLMRHKLMAAERNYPTPHLR
jgi:hypothetical protein